MRRLPESQTELPRVAPFAYDAAMTPEVSQPLAFGSGYQQRRTQTYLGNELRSDEQLLAVIRTFASSNLRFYSSFVAFAVTFFFLLGFSDRAPSVSWSMVIFLGGFVVLYEITTAFERPRLVVLTDRRLFILRSAPAPVDWLFGIDVVEQRQDVVLVPQKSRRHLAFRGADGQLVTLRLVSVRGIAAYLDLWATTRQGGRPA